MRPLLVVVMLALGVGGMGIGCGDNQDPPAMPPPPDKPDDSETLCAPLPAISSGTCEVTGAGGTGILLRGNVLTPQTMYRGGQVAVNAAGAITCVGCDCAAAGQVVVTCPDAAISPGLINTHDHITYTHNQPYTDSGVRYEHRHQWRQGQDGKPEIPYLRDASADQVRWGELRFLMGGATSIVGGGGQAGLLRNLYSTTNNQEGLGQPAVDFDTFPLGDISSGTRRRFDCNYGGGRTTAADIASLEAYEPHTAEGIDATARNEFLCQSSTTYDVTDATVPPRDVSNNLLLDKTAMIHGIGLLPADLGAMAAAGTGLIWSPRSNITLYGDTARVTTAARLGVEIALGTDWMPSGSMNMQRELRCADDFNRTYNGGYFTDKQLWQMVTLNAAAVTATDDVIGRLAPGRVADIAVFAGRGKTYRAVIEAEPADVALVMRGGKVLYGDDVAVGAFAGDCDAVDVCGTQKRVCLMSEVGKTYAQLQAGAGASIYPAFTCGAPPQEPSCTPRRETSVAGSTTYGGIPTPTDGDGDGIGNAADKCPSVFDPIRPLDNGVQPDADGDGQGDACDPCPLDAGATECRRATPGDLDHDGFADIIDNCIGHPNPDQADADGDGKGNTCDVCPDRANPGAAGCPATIYEIKSGATSLGLEVRLSNVLVTGKGSNGFFVQVKETDAGYQGPDYSGMMIFTGSGTPPLANATVGARVTIEGRVTSFQGQLELDNVTSVTVVAAGPEPAPAPVPATYAEIKTGGPRAAALEGVIVTVGASAVSAIDAPVGEFTVTAGGDSLVVDDFLGPPNPPPLSCTRYTSLTGILAHRQMASKLELRGAGDLVVGPPTLAQLGPAATFTRVGLTGAPTFPAPLTVTLCGPAQGDTTVTLASSDAAALTVTDVMIPDGQTSVSVPVTALAQSAAVTVTATHDGTMKTAGVRVLDPSEGPTAVALSSGTSTLPPGGTAQLTVTLDLPAAAGSGTDVAITIEPPTAGTVPPIVTVAENQLAATFPFIDTAGDGTVTVTATFGGSTSVATITVTSALGHLVINEIDYDQVSTDNAEFIEIHNPSPAAISLSGKQVILVNGTGSVVYDTIDLSSVGSLPAGGYLVIGGVNVNVPMPALKLNPTPGWTTDKVQNGAPDGIALIDNTTHVLIDALSYEGSMTMVTLPGFPAPISLVEGTVLPTATADSNTVAGSLCRKPNAQDTDNAASDWVFCTAPSAGIANP